jgi:hypothetical protein
MNYEAEIWAGNLGRSTLKKIATKYPNKNNISPHTKLTHGTNNLIYNYFGRQ